MKRDLSWAICSALTLVIGSCRIYRDSPSRDERETVASTARERTQNVAVTAGGQPPVQSEAPPAEALSLWVLNRPKTDLVARGADPPEESGNETVASLPPALALVVLGFGPWHPCAKRFAEHALQSATAGHTPLEAVSLLLDDMRRWRWPEAVGTLHATVKGSEGDFGAVQSADAQFFSPALLAAALHHHAVIDGQNRRWVKSSPRRQAASEADAAVPVCEPSTQAELHGPVGILLRTATGKIVAGMIDLERRADAGMLPIVTQFGVSVAVGEWGGVLLLSDCPAPPEGIIAQRVYAGLERGVLPEPPPAIHGCRLGYAVVTNEQARVIGTSSFAWASAEATHAAQTPAPAAPVASPIIPSRDAGAASMERLHTP